MEVGDLYNAVKTWNWKIIDQFVKNDGDINTKLISTGLEAGYTALHFAAMRDNQKRVKRLIEIYRADVNSVGENSAQPIHLACLLDNAEVAEALLEAGANPNAELTKELVDKYAGPEKWFDDFGDKMSLLTFAVLHCDEEMPITLRDFEANLGIKSIKNKTLPMYAVEIDYVSTAVFLLLDTEKYTGLLDARDDNGWHIVHYILPSKKFGNLRYGKNSSVMDSDCSIVPLLNLKGGDINATINGDPDTLLLNMAAYRSSWSVLENALNVSVPLSDKSRALHYALLPVDQKEYTRGNGKFMRKIDKRRRKTMQLILQNYVFRREFGIYVPDEEKKLMDQLVATDKKVEKIVRKYKNDFINGLLKDEVIQNSSCGRMTFYEAAAKVFNEKSLKELLEDDRVVETYKTLYYERFEYEIFEDSEDLPLIDVIFEKFKKAHKRRTLLKKVEKLEGLRKAVPLPYELVLLIIEYLDNNSLIRFVDAFYQSPISFREIWY